MKLIKGVYKASNVTFDTRTNTAVSYDWWAFCRVIDGVLVFNEYPYSKTTQRHQYKVKRLLEQLWLEVGLFVNVEESLKATNSLTDLTNRTRENLSAIKLDKAAKVLAARVKRKEKAKAAKLTKADFDKLDPVIASRFSNVVSFKKAV